MLAMINRDAIVHNMPRPTRWRGRSGRLYALENIGLDSFSLSAEKLSVVTSGSNILWIGSLSEVVQDHLSRARFRLALETADRVFALAAPADEVTRMTLIWDIEGGELAPFY